MQADHPPAEWLGEAQAGSSNVHSKGCGAGRQVVALHGEEASRGPQVGAGAGGGGVQQQLAKPSEEGAGAKCNGERCLGWGVYRKSPSGPAFPISVSMASFMSPPCLCKAGVRWAGSGVLPGGTPCLPGGKGDDLVVSAELREQRRRAPSHSSSLLCSKVIDERAGSTPDDIPWLQRSTTHLGLPRPS